MSSRIHSSFSITAATLLLLIGSTAAVNKISSSSVDPCKGLDDVTLNATGSFKRIQFSDLTKNVQTDLKEWTWHTGLDGTDLSSPKQYFWIDTTGIVNLNSPSSPYNDTCMTVFHLDMDSDFWNTPQNDTGDCQSMLGSDCLKALGSSIIISADGDCTHSQSGFTIPEECPMLKSMSASTFEFYPKVSGNRTCGSTEDNADGSKSFFYSTAIENGEAKDFTSYDKMAKVAHILAPMVRYTESTDSTEIPGNRTYGETKYVCVRNTDFAEGSRNPLPKKDSGRPTETGGSPTPTGGAMKASTGLESLVTAFFVGVFVLFN